MVNILNIKNDIIKILFYINVVSLIISIFLFSKILLIVVIIINVIFGGTCVLMINWADKFKAQFYGMWGTK